jgi:Ca2+-binding EF-hand superfamily protein
MTADYPNTLSSAPAPQMLRQSVDEMRTAFRLIDMRGVGKIPTTEVPLLLYAVGVDVSYEDVCSALLTITGEQLREVDFADVKRLVEFMSLTPDSDEEAAAVYDLICRQYAVSTSDGNAARGGEEAVEGTEPVMLPSTVSRLLAFAAPFTNGTRGSTFTVEKLFERMDGDGDGVVSRAEWVEYVSRTTYAGDKDRTDDS